MSTLAQVAEGLRARLATISGLSTRAYVPGSAEFPVAFPQVIRMDYEGLGVDDEDVRFEVVLLVSAALDSHQVKLYDYMNLTGPRSVPAAIAAQRNLGLADVDAFVLSSRLLGLQEQAAYRGWGCAFDVPVRFDP